MFYLIAIFTVIIDQLTKAWIRMNVAIGEYFQLWNTPMYITHYENTGAAFSSFQGYGRWFVPLAFFVVIFLIYYRKREGKRCLLELGAGFLAGGAIGNAIDRVLYNQVTDFITFGTNNGILNLADYALNIGLVLLIVDTINTELIQKRKKERNGENQGGISLKQALLVIDAQQAIIDGDGGYETGVFEKEILINNINKVVQEAVGQNIPIVFIRDTDVGGGEGPGFEVHPKINVPTEAEVFNKAATNSFYGTPLLDYLNDHNIEHLVVMGCKTEYCIDTAVRAATVNKFDVTLVRDGHSTSDSSVLSAQQIIQHHNRVLHGHDNVDHFALVRNSEDDLFNPIHNQYR